ncbi:hypothetical protein SS1G_01535 [Sclerotinia sclerotiorum 1980 UF-70]|uniref:Uncharacterized protein n=1 Tax=Sclerotinia sclerotiorum (strain ATCC 18683 / 1980 / Ss-1) TaxID=665079 RepID=A7E8A7_SCLS1|nr:hypothetical protein SS1G_01535 [Sclerotinia sclerotiorum 1980 UF-70]EDN96609.1 hypothetical protein SS1G_01535 [Sclerotinia sclerotiorum 1980 UF-70]
MFSDQGGGEMVEGWMMRRGGNGSEVIFWASGGWENVEEVVSKEGGYEDPVFVVRGRKTRGF